MVVSADGILRCPNGNTCINYKSHGDRIIALEFKSPYATKENPHVTVYEPSPRHVPQLLLEMKAWKCNELWLLCGTLESVTLMHCYEDVSLTNELLDTADALYGSEKPNVPTRLHPNVPILKNKIREYIKTHTSFLCEAPTVKGKFGKLTVSDVIVSAYAVTPNLDLNEMEARDVDFDTAVVGSETNHFFNNAHNVLRNKASEIVVFMATSKDRKNIDSVGYTFPVAYAMKGSTMTNSDLHYMVNALRKEFSKRSIPILAEVYDGQWHQFITTDGEGKSLTKLCWRHRWQDVSTYSKQKCLNLMIEGCSVKSKDLEILEEAERLRHTEQYCIGNVALQAKIIETIVENGYRRIRRQLLVKSTGGGCFRTPVIQQFVTVCKHSRPDLFPQEIGYSTCHTYADPIGTRQLVSEDESLSVNQRTESVQDHTYCTNPSNDNENSNIHNVTERVKR
ncbi:MAG: hypothetical protein MJE68_04735, partial [Proteobacteria bacterium]|nr:hypothetical protein [Pseudomonadota bacterium]